MLGEGGIETENGNTRVKNLPEQTKEPTNSTNKLKSVKVGFNKSINRA